MKLKSLIDKLVINEALTTASPTDINKLKSAAEENGKFLAFVTYNDRKSGYKKIAGPLRMTAYMGNNYGLSSDGVTFFNSYSKDTVYKDAIKGGVMLLTKSEAKKLTETIKYISNAFYKIPSPARDPQPSPYRLFGMESPNYAFDGQTLNINLDIPRAVRHPNEYYKELFNDPKYKGALDRINEIEEEVHKIASYVEGKGYKVNISAWY